MSKALADELMNARFPSRWIRASDALPDDDTWVITYDPTHPHPELRVGALHYDGGRWDDDEGRYGEPTRWMPMPDPPREDE